MAEMWTAPTHLKVVLLFDNFEGLRENQTPISLSAHWLSKKCEVPCHSKSKPVRPSNRFLPCDPSSQLRSESIMQFYLRDSTLKMQLPNYHHHLTRHAFQCREKPAGHSHFQNYALGALTQIKPLMVISFR